jgi:antitoxin ParD1/3/4
MSTMNVSLPASLKTFVDEQVEERGYGSSSEYMRELIRKEQDRIYLRGLLVTGAESAPGPAPDRKYFDGLRQRARRRVRRG